MEKAVKYTESRKTACIPSSVYTLLREVNMNLTSLITIQILGLRPGTSEKQRIYSLSVLPSLFSWDRRSVAGTTQLSVHLVRMLFQSEIKRLEREADHIPNLLPRLTMQ
jgi:hypothetical protein